MNLSVISGILSKNNSIISLLYEGRNFLEIISIGCMKTKCSLFCFKDEQKDLSSIIINIVPLNHGKYLSRVIISMTKI